MFSNFLFMNNRQLEEIIWWKTELIGAMLIAMLGMASENDQP